MQTEPDRQVGEGVASARHLRSPKLMNEPSLVYAFALVGCFSNLA